MNDDVEHLRLLTIGHYVCAAITALFVCVPLIYFAIGLIILLRPPLTPAGEQFDARFLGLIFALIGAAFVLCGWAIAACIFAAGRSIKAGKRRLFCVVVSAINCAFFHLGTALGVLSILVLSRPTVREMFNRQPVRDAAPQMDPRPGLWRDEVFDDIHKRNRN